MHFNCGIAALYFWPLTTGNVHHNEHHQTLCTGAPTPAAAPPAGVGSPIGARKIKLSALVDQTLDAEVTALPNGELQKMFEDYKTTYGDLPSTETEPTADQVAAVKQLLVSGSSPYIDFGVFGPHGQRILRKLTFMTYTLNSQGEWAKRELPGPPDFETWFSVYRCMRTTFLLLKAASAERLDSYCEFIRSMHNRFGAQCMLGHHLCGRHEDAW